MPFAMHQLGIVYLFQWYAMVVYWQYVSFSIARTVYHTTSQNTALFSKAVGLAGLVNGSYSLVAFLSAFGLIAMAKRFGAKWVHAGCLTLAGVGLWIFPHISDERLIFLPMVGFGIAWASMMGVPYIIICSLVPKARYGVYMGIVNMMIVVPMLIESFTFGSVYTGFLGSNPTHAIMFAGTFLLIGALAMLWLRAPSAEEESDHMPLVARHVRTLHLAKTIDVPVEAVVNVLRQGPREWLPDFQEENGQPTTELRFEEMGKRVARRVRVSLGDIKSNEPFGHGVSLPLEWEAVSHPNLYPRLDGTVRVEGRDGHSELIFDARYVPPGGGLGAAVDRVLMGTVARASLGDFFDRVTARLNRPAGLSG
jgi:hypothetical protein